MIHRTVGFSLHTTTAAVVFHPCCHLFFLAAFHIAVHEGALPTNRHRLCILVLLLLELTLAAALDHPLVRRLNMSTGSPVNCKVGL